MIATKVRNQSLGISVHRLFTFATSWLLFGVVVAQASPLPSIEFHQNGTWPGYPRDGAYDVAVQGSTVYLAVDEAGLVIVDISDPTNPTRHGGLELKGRAASIAVRDSLVYVLVWVSNEHGDHEAVGVEIIDVNDPTHPKRTGYFEREYRPTSYSGWEDGPPISKLVLGNGFVYLAAGSFLWSIDVSDPAEPVGLPRLGLSGFSYDAYFADNRVFVLHGTRVSIFDVADPGSPQRVGEYESGGTVYSVVAERGWVYLAGVGVNGESGFQVLDISDVSQPTALLSPLSREDIEREDGFRACFEVSFYDGYVLVASGSELRVLDKTIPGDPVTVDRYTSIMAKEIDVTGNLAIVTELPQLLGPGYGFHVIDLNHPEGAQRMGGYNTMGRTSDIEIVGQNAVIADGRGGIRRLDLTVPSRPILVEDPSAEVFNFASWIHAEAPLDYIVGGHTYFGFRTYQTVESSKLVDITPKVLEVAPFRTRFHGVDLVGTKAYFHARWHEDESDYRGLVIMDLNDGDTVQLLGTLGEGLENTALNPGSGRILVKGDFAFWIESYSKEHDGGRGRIRRDPSIAELRVADISNPQQARLLSVLQLSPERREGLVHDLLLNGDTIYVVTTERAADGQGEIGRIQIVDISDPNQMGLLETYFTGEFDYTGKPPSIVRLGDLLYVGGARQMGSDWIPHLHVLDMSDAATPVTVGGYDSEFWIESIAVNENHVYLAVGAEGIVVLEQFRPAELRLQGSHPMELSILGGLPPYQLQRRSHIERGKWHDYGPSLFGPTIRLESRGQGKFFRALSLGMLPVECHFRDDFNPDGPRVVDWKPGLAGAEDLYATGERIMSDEGFVWIPGDENMGAFVEGLSYQDASIHTVIRHQAARQSTGQFAYIIGRGGYFAGIDPTGDLAIWSSKFLATQKTDLNPVDHDVHLQFQMHSNALSLSAWEEGDSFPEVPQIQIQDDSLTGASSVGLFYNRAGNDDAVIFRFFDVRRLE